ncbi:hypothetical protein NQ314_012105 [Rhamnusium bicolor]|uniref:BTB domain-containing protein n=1 Tax=Rhamnusium bicolor TaxID=1586634 RepID=A0AAV8XG55_9CUCU|nr:hypothetical protein NQ314_012105 [Rhamnusium bicolor]
MARSDFIGTWEVIHCEYVKGAYNYDKYIKCLEGIRFRLDENGDVTWTVPEELKSVPLFSCEIYELYVHAGRAGFVLRFGAYAGHVFEFIPDKARPKESVTLTCEGLCTLRCVRINVDTPEVNFNIPFTLLPALEDGYFSDITITSSNNKQFKVHSTILELQGDDIDWNSDPPPFNNTPEDVLGTILHFLYSECLPENLTEDTVRQVITVASPYDSLHRLVNNCQLYLKNTALKQQIIGLANDMHSCMNQIIDRFHSRSNHSSAENIIANPAKLCFVVKQSIRDAALVQNYYSFAIYLLKRKNELSRNERHEIIRYAKSRLPILLTQLTKFLQALKNTFSSMSPSQRIEIANFLVPEIEVILDTVSMLIVHVDEALQQIIQGLFMPGPTKCKSNVGDMLSKTLRNLLHIRELTKLNTFHEHITCSLGLLVHKKENYNQMSPTQKVRSIARNLEQLIEELPIFLIRLEETAAASDEKLEWSDFKFCFKVGTSKVSDILHKLIVHSDSLQDVMLQVCELVQRDAFTQTLQCLGLLNPTASSSHTNDAPNMTRSSSYSTPKHQGYKLNLVESLCVPPETTSSLLSKLCLQLLSNEKKADMEFEVIGNSFNLEQQQTEEGATPPEEKCIIKSHRVIVAARCDWFRRALLILLEYLYSGRLKQDSLSTEQLVELLLLSDRYEMDSLKQTCEYALLSCIDAESVLYFLSMADQYNARVLRSRCLHFISQHHELTESEEFFELPISLQAEIFDCVWTQPSGRQSDMLDYSLEHLLPTSSASSNSLHYNSPGVTDLNSAVESMLLTPELDPNHSITSSLEDLHLEQNSSRMDVCLNQIRDIVGNTAPREILVQVILAADFDLRRAVNYYYARGNGDE